MDLNGPFFITPIKRWGVKSSSIMLVYIYVFATKAIHTMLINSLTTETFFTSLQRFVAKRSNSIKHIS